MKSERKLGKSLALGMPYDPNYDLYGEVAKRTNCSREMVKAQSMSYFYGAVYKAAETNTSIEDQLVRFINLIKGF